MLHSISVSYQSRIRNLFFFLVSSAIDAAQRENTHSVCAKLSLNPSTTNKEGKEGRKRKDSARWRSVL